MLPLSFHWVHPFLKSSEYLHDHYFEHFIRFPFYLALFVWFCLIFFWIIFQSPCFVCYYVLVHQLCFLVLKAVALCRRCPMVPNRTFAPGHQSQVLQSCLLCAFLFWVDQNCYGHVGWQGWPSAQLFAMTGCNGYMCTGRQGFSVWWMRGSTIATASMLVSGVISPPIAPLE